MKLLVTGATGKLGTLVVEALLRQVPASDIAVSVRDPQKAGHWRELGVDVRYGNFNDEASLVSAFAGIDRLLFISTDDLFNRVSQHKAAIRAARAANVGFIAYTSAPNAAASKLALAKDHRETEAAIRESGIPYAILRNNWYLENEAGTFHAVMNGAPWVSASGTGKVGWATRRDFADAAVSVLTGQGHENKIYELSGQPRTQEELAAIFAEAMQRDVQVVPIDDEAYAGVLKQAGLPEAAIPMFVSIQQNIREGELDIASDDLERLLGRPATPLGEAIRQLLG
ncbi:SDR family oxidoreductase [Paenibacillus cymbidii]|uniref:SDR family oxidoreductase n=1 Tax=Paenibacillus cymbidii TaxID=1639034 RepID=UPI0010810332|nr:SDR family oxidoreductase [Paenibacillus cymbidii]